MRAPRLLLAVLPVALAVLVATLLAPISRPLRRWCVPRVLASLITLILGLGMFGGMVSAFAFGASRRTRGSGKSLQRVWAPSLRGMFVTALADALLFGLGIISHAHEGSQVPGNSSPARVQMCIPVTPGGFFEAPLHQLALMSPGGTTLASRSGERTGRNRLIEVDSGRHRKMTSWPSVK